MASVDAEKNFPHPEERRAAPRLEGRGAALQPMKTR
jgi:hypothetical protein